VAPRARVNAHRAATRPADLDMDNTQLPPGMFTPERPRNANGDSTIDQVRHAFPSPASLSRLKFLSRTPRARRARAANAGATRARLAR
jgi:hypothetical protein